MCEVGADVYVWCVHGQVCVNSATSTVYNTYPGP